MDTTALVAQLRAASNRCDGKHQDIAGWLEIAAENLERQELVIKDSARLVAASTPDQQAIATAAIAEGVMVREGLIRIRDSCLTAAQCQAEAERLLAYNSMRR